MPPRLPQTTCVLVVRKAAAPAAGATAPYTNDAALVEQPTPRVDQLTKGQLLVKITAAAYNHRDLWIRKGQYPGVKHGSAFGADGAGVVLASGIEKDPLLNKRVFLVPMRGWESNAEAPESKFTIIGGGGDMAPLGTFAQYVVVDRDQVIASPAHLDDEHVAAWPLAGVTAWRAAVVNADVQAGQNVLITGVGGGVALIAVQLCLARGANVYVSSGHSEKIQKAMALGAKGGVSYKEKGWPAKLAAMLKTNAKGSEDALLSAVIDSGGGDILGQVSKILKSGGKVVVYGMTASPKVTLTMREVLKNQRLIGSTMGSHKDLIDATQFLSAHRITPVVSHVLDGLESAEEGFRLIEQGDHFGKIVIRVRHGEEGPSRVGAKL
ncbi:hypothetical protein EUX98_g4356 [Antrodiella citrinella]|uniref:Enoyl reductase (ER) domain-containing protein n=1 Tax=Antrodiella citrinella TaxID=2447956 RepID=A0A4S4MV79_9APHY|nr:hypothetical protein EUX98_g4356 [Antrodiella citrinella]